MKSTQNTIVTIFGKVCSGKDTYVKENYPSNCLHIDIGNVVRELTKTQSRTHDKTLDDQIIEYLHEEIYYSKANTTVMVITGIRQLKIFKFIECTIEETKALSEVILLEVPESILKIRYDKRSAEKDKSISFEDTIKRDGLLGYEELEQYLRTVNNLKTIENYNRNEIDTL